MPREEIGLLMAGVTGGAAPAAAGPSEGAENQEEGAE
jgi:hypothetical protein